MVHIVRCLICFQKYAENVRQGFYIEKPALEGEIEIRIIAGKLGYQATLKKDSAEHEYIKQFLKVHGFTQIETSIEADFFLR